MRTGGDRAASGSARAHTRAKECGGTPSTLWRVPGAHVVAVRGSPGDRVGRPLTHRIPRCNLARPVGKRGRSQSRLSSELCWSINACCGHAGHRS